MHVPVPPKAGRIALVCFAVSMIDGFDTLMLSFLSPLISASLQLDPASLGRVFGAGFVGTVLGSILVGPAADRFGRRPMVVLALLLTGLLTIACAFAGSAESLAALRFVGGIGMGAAIPPVAAITAENSAPARRSSLVILMFIGFPFGAVVGGALCSLFMLRLGWQWVFAIGGMAALVAIIPVLLIIPAAAPRSAASLAPPSPPHNHLARLFGQGRAAATVALWCGILASMVLSGFLLSFIPTVLTLNGVAADRAALGAVLLNLGAIAGALLLSTLVGRAGPYLPVACGFLLGALAVFALGQTIGTGNLVFPLLFLVGLCIVGGQLTFPAIASHLFPREVRAAGIGWAMAIGRTGSILGPVVGGVLLARSMALSQIFLVATLLALCGAASIALAHRLRPRGGDAGPNQAHGAPAGAIGL